MAGSQPGDLKLQIIHALSEFCNAVFGIDGADDEPDAHNQGCSDQQDNDQFHKLFFSLRPVVSLRAWPLVFQVSRNHFAVKPLSRMN